VHLAVAARALRDVVLEVRVALRHARDGLDRGGGKRRAPEIGVDDHAGGVDHRLQ
jgi:hypothetical protein